MDTISVRCKMCKHAMKFSAEKAGKRAKCPKCDAVVLIGAEEKPEASSGAVQKKEAAPEPAPATVATVTSEEDDGAGQYDVFTDPEIEERKKKIAAEEEERLKNRKKKKDKNLPTVTRKVKAIPDAELWKKVRLGLLFTFFGVLIWGFTHVLQSSYVLLGSVEFPEYAFWIGDNLEKRGGEADLPPKGEFWAVDDLRIYLGMIAGRDLAGTAKTCLILGTLLYFFQALAWGAGSVIALPVPRRFGMFGQLITSLVLGIFNFLIMFVFKLLPVLGILGYVMIPFVTPEIVLTEYNMERTVPIHVMWSSAPYWENFFTLIFRTVFYLQPALGCIFLWSIGTTIRDEGIEQSGRGMAQMCLGTLFIQVCFHFLSLCGATPVLVIVLRVFYCLWFGFLLLFIAQYAVLILKVRSVLYDKIYPKNELLD